MPPSPRLIPRWQIPGQTLLRNIGRNLKHGMLLDVIENWRGLEHEAVVWYGARCHRVGTGRKGINLSSMLLVLAESTGVDRFVELS
mmetsp:Transcript_46171/g.122384  ORF Transcript_46171/g.122384 Transcript_46171/m.122384 type:complete len:86 (-) Transcript_46171:1616-1873(-)